MAIPDSRLPISDSRLFVLVAGEASGDLLGADLIAGLKQRFPNARFAGIGGPHMLDAGLDLWHPAQRLSVMGLVEVLKHLPGLLALRNNVYKRTLQLRPDVFIGIDAPDFNLGLERRLKRAGVRTAHYVSPSVWAWREARAAKIGRSADRVLCLFPMEPPIYARHGVDARFVGHPLAAAFAIAPDKAAARRTLGLAEDATVLALLPGSRLGEIARLGRDFLETAILLRQQFPQLQIVAPMANAECRAAFEALLPAEIGSREPGTGSRTADVQSGFPATGYRLPASVTIIDGQAHTAMIAADAVLLASGTAALEAMLAKRPMVVAYRVAALTYRLVKIFGLLRTDVYSLPNILACRTVVPELMQDACTPPALAAVLAPMLRARALPPNVLQEFVCLHESLRADAEHGAAAAVAELAQVAISGSRA
ncbi:MAG TPA: lipid-A-disaccharide synthase [Rudaea sp.]|jgi:lipid-A-disaccharide synthase|uniref:lipid-A-disaccharide synthase n=1 Tax=Rudaea sp. TaxID=2136325 RepID=UPI002F954FCC